MWFQVTSRGAVQQKGEVCMVNNASDENKLDTDRIQKALNGCPAGQAVVLEHASARLDAFLTGPLKLRRGVALVMGAGATLYGSRNPRDYDVSPDVCGTIDKSGRGCQPLIGMVGPVRSACRIFRWMVRITGCASNRTPRAGGWCGTCVSKTSVFARRRIPFS